jgi:hypothetical protein
LVIRKPASSETFFPCFSSGRLSRASLMMRRTLRGRVEGSGRERKGRDERRRKEGVQGKILGERRETLSELAAQIVRRFRSRTLHIMILDK